MNFNALRWLPLTDYRAPLDFQVYQALNRLNHWPAVAGLAEALSSQWFAWLCSIIAVLLLVRVHRARAAVWLGRGALAVFATDRLGAALWKPLFHRLRPCYALPAGTFRQILPAANQGALPSLHAANAFALAMVVGLAWPKARRFGFTIAALVALSRVVGGVHWPSDVIAGALYGSLVGWLASWRVPRVGFIGSPHRLVVGQTRV